MAGSEGRIFLTSAAFPSQDEDDEHDEDGEHDEDDETDEDDDLPLLALHEAERSFSAVAEMQEQDGWLVVTGEAAKSKQPRVALWKIPAHRGAGVWPATAPPHTVIHPATTSRGGATQAVALAACLVQHGEAVAVLTQSDGLSLYSMRGSALHQAWSPGTFLRDGCVFYDAVCNKLCTLGHEESGWSKTHHAVQGCLYEHHVGVPPRDAVLSRVFLEQRIPFDDRAELRQVRFPSRIHWAVIIPSSSRQGPEEADEEEVDEQPLRVIGTLDQLQLGECDECRRIA